MQDAILVFAIFQSETAYELYVSTVPDFEPEALGDPVHSGSFIACWNKGVKMAAEVTDLGQDVLIRVHHERKIPDSMNY